MDNVMLNLIQAKKDQEKTTLIQAVKEQEINRDYNSSNTYYPDALRYLSIIQKKKKKSNNPIYNVNSHSIHSSFTSRIINIKNLSHVATYTFL
jgi:hypothetical protein